MNVLLLPDCVLGLVADYIELHEAYAMQAPAMYLLKRSRAVLSSEQGAGTSDERFAQLYVQDATAISSTITKNRRMDGYRALPHGLRLLILELSTRERYGQARRRGQPAAPRNRSWKFVKFELDLFGTRLFAELRLRLNLSDADFARRFVTSQNEARFLAVVKRRSEPV